MFTLRLPTAATSRCRVTDISYAIAIRIELLGVTFVRTVVSTSANPISIYIICGVIRTIVTSIPKAIVICISLSGIRNIGAVVSKVGDAIAVSIRGEAFLFALYTGASTATGCCVANIADSIVICIKLRSITNVRAIIFVIGNIITIAVKLQERACFTNSKNAGSLAAPYAVQV